MPLFQRYTRTIIFNGNHDIARIQATRHANTAVLEAVLYSVANKVQQYLGDFEFIATNG
jgi:hypothetical protein